MTDNIYKVNGYSDKELYDILDLVNPSDRELEAKILHMIWKYDNMGNSQHLSTFFRDIYDRFFDDGNEEEIMEGFTTDDVNTAIGSGTTATTGSNISAIPTANPNADTEKKDKSAVLGYSFPLDYTKDTLNPLLKQTTKRIVSIDSQYRDTSKYPLSSQYTFNLSNTLKDVVNLRLYSIQLPYTWYTINDSYGSNFFYLKGNSPGINNGLHDIKVEIGIGNYTASDLITTVNNSITALKTDIQYSDISFGTTQITYGTANSKAMLDVKLKKRYDESFYSMEFSDWTTPRLDLTTRNISIPSFLGLDLQKYNAYSITSKMGSLPSKDKELDAKDNYVLDTSNNSFTIIHYLPPGGDTSIEYITNPGACTVLDTIKITLPLKLGEAKSRTAIETELNKQLLAETRLLNSSITRIQSPLNSFPSQIFTYYSMDIRLNRTKTQNVPNSKVAVIFNDSSVLSPKIWTGTGSVFEFEVTDNEVNTLVSKVNTVQQQIDIKSSPKMLFKCITPYFNGRDPTTGAIISGANLDLSMNDFYITVPNDTYTLNGYISTINQLLKATTVVNATESIKITEISKKMEFRMDIKNTFGTSKFKINLTDSVLKTIGLTNTNNFGLTIIGDTDLTTTNVFTGTFAISGGGYTIPANSTLMKIIPKTDDLNKKIKYVPEYTITTSNTVPVTYANIGVLQTGLNSHFTNFTDSDRTDPNNLMANTRVVITQSVDTATIQLLVEVEKVLSEASYEVSFIDASANQPWSTEDSDNSWAFNLKIPEADKSFKWKDYAITESGILLSKYPKQIDVATQEPLLIDTIILNSTNNKISFNTVALTDGGEGIYTDTSANNVIIYIPIGEYSRDVLFAAINTQLSVNPITRGSNFSGIKKGNDDYTRIRFNINKIYDASDYRLVFYDPFSFAKCNAGSSSVRNSTWDSTLGWTMGFRDKTEYELSYNAELITNIDAHQTTYKTKKQEGDTAVSVSIYNYFMIVLDDYNQSHMNAGVVTTTQSETDIPLPTYTNRALIRCDPITKAPITDTRSSTGVNLTRNQLIAQQTISDEKEAQKKNKQYSKGPFTKDVFALVPLKLAGLPNNSVYVESGGTLQDQERTYFGPVNISRMTVKLVNDRGEIVNLNGANWSFSFICEQLYKK
jgi:hypothetical protein